MIGFSQNLKIKKVDKLLKQLGYDNYTAYYSPIASWLTTLSILLYLAVGLLWLIISLWSIVLIYFLIGYLIIARFNNNIVVAEHELLIINTHFPFRKHIIYPINSIQQIRIADKGNALKCFYLLGIFTPNFLEIKRNNQIQRHYCFFQETDYYDENWLENTLEDLHLELKSKGIQVKYDLD